MLFISLLCLLASTLLALCAVAYGSSHPDSSTEMSLYSAAVILLIVCICILIFNGGSL